MEPQLPADCAARFRLERRLAGGGTSAVYLATQVALERPAAVKLLDARGTLELDVRRFLEEARITAALAHPGVVIVLDVGYDAGVPWIAYEYIESGTLRDRLEGGPLAAGEAAAAAQQVCVALQAAHDRGVLHRDVKPDNVFALPGARVKIADFGIAKLTQSTATKTKTGVILGTPAYVAPEQVRGEPASARSDVYATGVLLYELLTGITPYRSDSLVKLLSARLERDAPPPSTHVAVDPALEAVLMRSLARDPAERWPTAQAFADALTPFARAAIDTGAPAPLPAPARGAKRKASNATLPVTARSEIQTRVAAVPPPPRRPWMAAGLAAAGLALAIFSLSRPKPAVVAPSSHPAPASTHAVRVSRLMTVDDAARAHLVVEPPAPLAIEVHERGERISSLDRTAPAADSTVVDVAPLKPEHDYELVVRAGATTARFPFRTRARGFNQGFQQKYAQVTRSDGRHLAELTAVADLGTEIDDTGDYRGAERLAQDLSREMLVNDLNTKHLAYLAYRTRSLKIVEATMAKTTAGIYGNVPLLFADTARRLGRADIARRLMPRQVDPDPAYEISAHVVNLGALDGGKAFDTILALIARRPAPEPLAVARALTLADEPRARARFRAWLSGPATPEEHALALHGLSLERTPEAVAILTQQLTSLPTGERSRAARALAESRADGAAAALVDATLKHTDNPGQVWDATRAALAMEPSAGARLAAHLARLMLGEAPPSLRAAAAGAAGLLPDAALNEPLRTALADADGLVAGAAAWACARRNDAGALPALRALTGTARDRHGAGAWALERLAGAAATPDLLRAAEALPAPLAPRDIVRAGLLAVCLARHGHPQAEALFQRIAQQDGRTAKAFREMAAPAGEGAVTAVCLFPFVGYDVVPVARPGHPLWMLPHEAWPRDQASTGLLERTSVLTGDGWLRPPNRPEELRPSGDVLVSPVEAGAGAELGAPSGAHAAGVQLIRFWGGALARSSER